MLLSQSLWNSADNKSYLRSKYILVEAKIINKYLCCSYIYITWLSLSFLDCVPERIICRLTFNAVKCPMWHKEMHTLENNKNTL